MSLSDSMRKRLHPLMAAYIDHLYLREKDGTAINRTWSLLWFFTWTSKHGIDPVHATRANLEAFQAYLVTDHRSKRGKPLARITARMRMSDVKSWFRWLTDRGELIADPSKTLGIKVVESRTVMKEHLDLQEATALIQTKSAMVADAKSGSREHARALRDLAAICLSIAMGGRLSGIAGMTVDRIDLDRNEVRIDREKGQPGRVLPVAAWAMEVVRWYLTAGRPRLCRGRPATPWAFLDRLGDRPISKSGLMTMLGVVMKATIEQNPDLVDLPGKRISWHSLRVTFSTLLFRNGCDIRSVNELMRHKKLSTTAKYCPIPVEDLRAVFRTAHPRA
jgi:integrase/recombinase XerD